MGRPLFCEGCGQSAINVTKAGRPICPDCIEEGYGEVSEEQTYSRIENMSVADMADRLKRYEAALREIAGDRWDASGCNPQIMRDTARFGLGDTQ